MRKCIDRPVLHFTVADVRFDFTTWNPQPLNMDGIHLDGGCHYGRISNLHGRCFDAIVVRDCFASSAPPPDFSHVNTGAVWPMVWVQDGCDVGSLVVENLCRHETYSAKAPTIQVDDGARVETMTVRNCRLTRSIEASPEFFRGRSNVGTLSVEPGLVSFR